MKYSIGKRLDFDSIQRILTEKATLELSSDAKQRIHKNRMYLDKKLSKSDDSVYGVNTGFGALHGKKISDNDLEQLQINLVMSHACGMGAEVPQEIVKLMLLLKIQGLSLGFSGVQTSVVERLIDLFNFDLLPVVYTQGSLGASGDLAPLAHLSLPLLGLGEVYVKGKKMPAKKALAMHGLSSVKLKSKEGLALLNGTQFMSAYGVYLLMKAERLANWADVIAGIAMDGFDCRTEPFDMDLHLIRPHAGQIATAKNISDIRKGSKIAAAKKSHVQDPYSFRCVPQVHGASKDAMEYVASVFLTEINSVTDNPVVIEAGDKILSGGNFHGQALALAFDFLTIALAELGNISERRTYQLISGQRGLPPFLVVNAGLNSGLMIPQYTAASIVSANKQLCTPSSVDSIVSSNGQEDHVSMGANAGVKCFTVAENLQRILAIELFTAAQALDFRRPAKSSALIEDVMKAYRKRVAFVKQDRILHDSLIETESFLSDYAF